MKTNDSNYSNKRRREVECRYEGYCVVTASTQCAVVNPWNVAVLPGIVNRSGLVQLWRDRQTDRLPMLEQHVQHPVTNLGPTQNQSS